jgi:predicted nucleic acid-binding Zn ribbon protein
MRRFLNLPPQIVRLLLLVVGIVVVYATARYFLTPASFRQYGWYRGEALAEIRARQPVFAGKKACEECHSDQVQKLQKFEHKPLSCEACHGALKAHVDNPDVQPQKSGFGICLRCHEANPSRPKWHKQIVVKTHYGGGKCSECHVPHAPAEVP